MNTNQRYALVDNRYQLLAQLGEGASSVVWRARDIRLGRDVALKLFSAEYCADECRRKRALQEARAGTNLDHPHIAKVFDVGCADDALYIVSELLDGETLESYLRGRLCQLDEAFVLIDPIFKALSAAHHARVVHRDVKPANIFLARDQHGNTKPVLLDFGVAKIPASIGMFDGLTTAHARIGTMGYASCTALWSAADCGIADDAHALACTLYQMLAGELPNAEVGSCEAAADRLVLRNPTVPREVAAAICQGLRWGLAGIADIADIDNYARRIDEARRRTHGVSAALVILAEAVPERGVQQTHDDATELTTVFTPPAQQRSPLRALAITTVICASIGALFGAAAATASEPIPRATILPKATGA